ncbi:protein kinase family protein [Streptomyces sp. NPDC050803]|uniref:protein kinase family protein n=1 Tax=unclassified Streptomyces TaxID=2593676 RepID=UPI00343103DD
MPTPESRHAARVSAYAAVGTHLSLLSDRRLEGVLAAAPALGSGIGGRSAQTEIDGTRVFVKRVPLTDIELQPRHLHSTANLFELPLFYQYGVGSAGFGAWRELAAHIMTTGWVLQNEYAGFPLLYHWRVLPDSAPAGFVDAFGGIEGAVAHWDGSPAVRRRLEAVATASHSLVLFLEHVPHTLAEWLGAAQLNAEPPYQWAEEALEQGTRFMSERGFVHFDAHFANVLTDGRHLYFADFGLALSRAFELSAQERTFLTDHLVYDRSYAPNHLLRHHLPADLRQGADHGAFLRAWVEGRRPGGISPELGSIIDRHAPHAVVLADFHRRLLTESKRTPFPAAEVRRALAGASTRSL